MTSERMVRDTTEAEVDARMLADIRSWRATRHPSSGDRVVLFLEEVDMILRLADERDALRRELCAEPDPKYVVRTCGACGHEPHGAGFLCIRQTCPCRNDRSFQ